VRDEGIGIDESCQQKLGTILADSLIYRKLTRTLQVQGSELGNGTKFWFSVHEPVNPGSSVDDDNDLYGMPYQLKKIVFRLLRIIHRLVVVRLKRYHRPRMKKIMNLVVTFPSIGECRKPTESCRCPKILVVDDGAFNILP